VFRELVGENHLRRAEPQLDVDETTVRQRDALPFLGAEHRDIPLRGPAGALDDDARGDHGPTPVRDVRMPALCAPSRVVNNAEVGELRIRRTPTLPNGEARLDPEAGETEVHGDRRCTPAAC